MITNLITTNPPLQPLLIIFQHEDFVVVEKPSNTTFHQEKDQQGFFNHICQQLGCKLWPVHRLDRITSGLLIVAKNKTAATQLGKLFEERKVHKTYWAISDKKPKKKQGTITGDMEKSRSGSWKLCHTKINPAITKFKSYSISPGVRFFEIEPKTGKTHQIRVALKSLGSPILGDTRYSGTKADRGYLHAYQLTFNWKNEKISLTSPPSSGRHFNSEEFQNLLVNKISRANN